MVAASPVGEDFSDGIYEVDLDGTGRRVEISPEVNRGSKPAFGPPSAAPPTSRPLPSPSFQTRLQYDSGGRRSGAAAGSRSRIPRGRHRTWSQIPLVLSLTM